jgi:DNA-directed RNA polymerase subunit H (RpoH/RPB5)
MAVTPSTKAKLQILDPITFPMVKSGLPERAAFTLTNNSGEEVPKATIVKPTTKGEILKRKAMLVDPLTKKSPPRIRTKSPAKRKIKFCDIKAV